MNFIYNESAQKLRGGYYTPLDLAVFAAKWVAGIKPEKILEPSCGDGAFLQALFETNYTMGKVTAIELDPVEAHKAKLRSKQLAIKANVLNADFLGWALDRLDKPSQRFDAVLGNPPFIRYQYLPETFQVEAEKIFVELGCKFTKHTNAWVPFVLASIKMLRPGGRLCMVVPSEIIHVLHAQSLRSFLLDKCRKIVLIDPEEIWFEDTLQGAVLLMAETKTDPNVETEGLGLVPVRGRGFLNIDPESVFNDAEAIAPQAISAKWTRAFLSHDQREMLDAAIARQHVRSFKDVADVDVGIVTGANKFFLVNDDIISKFGLEQWAHPMFGRSEHCPGIVYDNAQHKRNKKAGLPANFLWFPDDSVLKDRAAAKYIKTGEKDRLQDRYKCRIRKNWYSVPSVFSTPIGMLKRSHSTPKMILNNAGAFSTDTAYRIQLLEGKAEAFVSNFINPLTALSAELEGRTYGGGVLELVPSEIERLLVPSLTHAVNSIKVVDKAIRTMKMADVQFTLGTSVLTALGFDEGDRKMIYDGWIQLMSRRQRVEAEPDVEQDSVDLN